MILPLRVLGRASVKRMMSGRASYEERVEFHHRLALPFACLAFALIGLPLGVPTTRGSKSMGLVLSLILMLTYYIVFVLGTKLASNAQFSPFLELRVSLPDSCGGAAAEPARPSHVGLPFLIERGRSAPT